MSSRADTKEPTNQDQVIEALSNNVISIPPGEVDEDTARQIGADLLSVLGNYRNLLPKYDPEVAGDVEVDLSESLRQTLVDLAHLTPTLYLTIARYGQDIGRIDAEQVEQARDTHTCLNAFICVQPSDALKIYMGQWAVQVLGKEDRAFVSINKS